MKERAYTYTDTQIRMIELKKMQDESENASFGAFRYILENKML